MTTVAIACHTIEDEVMKVVRDECSPIPIIWVESGLHAYPDKLKQRLQEEIDKIDNVDNILLVFGYCGNCLVGLVSNKARLIIPRVDDCISLLMGGNRQRVEFQKEGASYFLTKGWLHNEANILNEFDCCIKKYGEQRALKVFNIMLANYKSLTLIDTNTYTVDDIIDKTREFAAKLCLKHQVITGALHILNRAFRMDWSEGFITVEPGKVIDLQVLEIIKDGIAQPQSSPAC